MKLLGVTYRYPEQREFVLKNVQISVSPGEIVCCMGESGSGKSTLGKLLIKQLLSEQIPVSWVPQQVMQSFPPLIRLGTFVKDVLRFSPEGNMDDFHKWATWLALSPAELLNKTPEQCSGGMLQRTALALAFARKTPWLIADEATSALDEVNRARVISATLHFVEQVQPGVFWITHQLEEAKQLGHTICEFAQGEMISYQKNKEVQA